MNIETTRCIIRNLTPEDATDLYKTLSDEHVIFHLYEEDSYEIGWIIRREDWGRGIAGEVTEALAEYARTLDAIHSCVIECDPGQEASKRIALKHGFTYEGEEDDCDVFRLRF